MTIQEKREKLKALSLQATELKEKMLHACTNDEEIHAVNSLTTNQILIKHFYTDADNTEFKSFKGWIKEGKVVRKGQKAFLVWGRPNQPNKEGEVVPVLEDDENGRTFYPVSFIFSNAQVRENKKETA